MNRLRRTTSCALAAACWAIAFPAYAISQGKDAAGNDFVSGGVSHAELRELQQMKDDHRLSIVTTARSGAYLAGARVRITDRSGNTVLETEMDGPWLLADPPPGQYRLEVDFEGQVRRQPLTVPKQGHEEINLYFDSPADVSPDLPPNRPRAG